MPSRLATLAALLALSAGPARAAATAPTPAPGAPFAVDLYRALKDQKGNLAFSPASVEMALTLAWAGARGPTATEMARLLRVSGPPGAVLPAVRDRIARLGNPARKDLTLRVANRLFAEKSYALLKPYLDLLAAIGAPLEEVDFRRGAEAARGRINGWVAQETANRIANLLPPGSVNAETRLALVNAVYLLADWSEPFLKEATAPRPFHPPGGPARDVPTMHRLGFYRYAETEGVRLLEIPYVGGELAMVLVLPEMRAGLGAVEAGLDAAALSRWMAALRQEKVSVLLPKFTVDPAEPIALAGTLRALGVVRAFDRARADFTLIASPADPADRLALSRVYHKAFVKVDEKGTEAAAATALLMQRAGAAPDLLRPKEFKADHPFLFLIRDLKTGALVFMGRVADPSAS